jgi:hypothetical protein
MTDFIEVRIDVICGSSKDSDRTIGRSNVLQVPDCGEVINYEGDPFVVHSRAWALPDCYNSKPKQYCYLRVSPLQMGWKWPEPRGDF